MQLMDESLQHLYTHGMITAEEFYARCEDKKTARIFLDS